MLHYDRAYNRYWRRELLYQYGAYKLAEDAAEAMAASTRHCDYFIGRWCALSDLLKGADGQVRWPNWTTTSTTSALAWLLSSQRGVPSRLRPAMDTLGFYLKSHVHQKEGLIAFHRLTDAIDAKNRTRHGDAYPWAGVAGVVSCRVGPAGSHSDLLDQAEALCDHPVIDKSERLFEIAFIKYSMGISGTPPKLSSALLLSPQRQSWEATVTLGGWRWGWADLASIFHGPIALSRHGRSWRRASRSLSATAMYASWSSYTTACLIFATSSKGKSGHGSLFYAERALALAEDSGNRKGQAEALRDLTSFVGLDGNLQEAEVLARKAIGLYRSLGVKIELALAIFCKGQALPDPGRYRGR